MVPELIRDPSFLVGAWGAVIATVLAVLRWRDYRRDRGYLKLRGSVESRGGYPCALLDVTNHGRRPVYLHDLGIKQKGGKRTSAGSNLRPPHRLDEYQSVTIEVGVSAFDDDAEATSLYVQDSTGRQWNLSTREFRKLHTKQEELKKAYGKSQAHLMMKDVLESIGESEPSDESETE
jgi:hypothetical protein